MDFVFLERDGAAPCTAISHCRDIEHVGAVLVEPCRQIARDAAQAGTGRNCITQEKDGRLHQSQYITQLRRMAAILLQFTGIMGDMKKLAILLALLLWPALALGQTGAYSGHTFVGGLPATTSGMNSSNYMDGIIPGASITVYLTGTTTKATIYADGSNTPLSNPFFSNLAPGTNPGGFIFWAAQNQGLDIQAQGGMGNASCTTSPLCYPTATTLQVDVYPNNSFSPLPSLNCTGTGSSQVCTFYGTVQGATLTDGTASLHAGSLTGAVNGTFSGTVAAGTPIAQASGGTGNTTGTAQHALNLSSDFASQSASNPNAGTFSAETNTTATANLGTTAPCQHLGDSISADYYATPNTNGWTWLLDAAKGWTCSHLAVAGAEMMDTNMAQQILTTSVPQNQISTYMIGTNDMRSSNCTGCSGGMNSAAAQAQWQSGFMAELAWLAIPDGNNKVTGQNCPTTGTISCTFSGTWTNGGGWGGAIAKQSSTIGNTVTIHFSGTAFYFFGIQQYGNTGSYTLTLDGANLPNSPSTFSDTGYITQTFNGGTGMNYSPTISPLEWITARAAYRCHDDLRKRGWELLYWFCYTNRRNDPTRAVCLRKQYTTRTSGGICE